MWKKFVMLNLNKAIKIENAYFLLIVFRTTSICRGK